MTFQDNDHFVVTFCNVAVLRCALVIILTFYISYSAIKVKPSLWQRKCRITSEEYNLDLQQVAEIGSGELVISICNGVCCDNSKERWQKIHLQVSRNSEHGLSIVK